MCGKTSGLIKSMLLAAASLLAVDAARAQTPAGSTGQCKDGSYTTAAKKWQACSGHKGVQSWYAEGKAATATTAPAGGAAGVPAGGSGMVWLNEATKVYHCPGGAFYGKTKNGKYVSEADARSAGARPDHNKPCAK